MRIILLVIPVCLLVLAEARRAQQIRPRVEQPQVYYVDEDDQGSEEEESPVVYQPRTRALPSPRSKDSNASKPPPVQTIRNYNKVNDDGSFTFGYEAADGSFKEETRGTDCVVRGKYGYVDPDGNKREFTYVSGNPCDPNAPKEDDDEPARGQQEDDVSGPANYPSVRPVPRPNRPTYTAPTTRAPTTVFQSQYEIADDDESQELVDIRPQPVQPQRRPSVVTIPRRQQYNSQTPATPTQSTASIYQSPATRYPTQTTPAPAPAYRTSPASPSTIYRAFEASTTPSPRPQTYRPPFVPSVSITPRPHAAQVAAQYTPPSQTERPGVIFASASPSHLVNHRTTSTVSPAPVSASPSATSLDFAAELERYVNTVGISPRPVRPTRPSPPPQAAKVKTSSSATDPIYQSELVYDPTTGQYNTQLYQTLPQTIGDFSLSHKLQPFVSQPAHLQRQQHQLQQLQQDQDPRQSAPSVYRQQTPASSAAPQPQEAIFRQQQSQIFQQSQQLYAQQQRRQQQPHRFQLLESQQGSQPFYYISPSRSSSNDNASPLSVGQIDQFLRGATNAF